MKDISKILVPFEFSTVSENALIYTFNFVYKDPKTEIFLFHCSSEEIDEDYKNKLAVKAQKIIDRFPAYRGKIHWLVQKGNLVENALQAQKEHNIGLIIMGTHGTDKDDENIETNTSKMVIEADCPVFVIPNIKRDFAIKKIALVLGKKEIEDATVLEVLLRIARRFNSEVHVLTIFNEDDENTYTDTDEKNESLLEYYLYKFYKNHAFKKAEDIEKGIFEYIEEREIDLLSILPRNHAKKYKPSEGRLTKLLALHTDVPLLTID